ncbi:MAG TPA: glyoxalase superfamily protein [Candidatus Baltobacteraceae bacterium]|nr:glyoxalase superfamily protein [Candidatus Baltobacteraceae bacterium]
MAITFERIVPLLQISDREKAWEFYIDFLGFTLDWERSIEPGLPLSAQVSRGNLVLRLIEDPSNSSSGVRVRVETTGVEELQRELASRKYAHMNPSLERAPWGELVVGVIDPFGNRIYFCEPIPTDA